MATHYYIGAIMISGEDILKAELREPALPIASDSKSSTEPINWACNMFVD